MAQLPVPLADSPLFAARLFNLLPGDQLGYSETERPVGSPPCSSRYTLRLVESRQIVGDSLIYVCRQQSRVVHHSSQGCGPPGAVLESGQRGRMAFSLRTGQSPQYPALPFLSGEYRRYARYPGQQSIVVGLGVGLSATAACQPSNGLLAYEEMFVINPSSGVQYTTVTDGNWFQRYGYEAGLGNFITGNTTLQYFLRVPGMGCGPATNYANLLPARAAQAAAVAILHPNPTTETITLVLASAARHGTRLLLFDALGRQQGVVEMAAGQTVAALTLASLPAGVYWLTVQADNQVPVTKRLVKE
ncbi:T9SS type A sorting domain-containing protein [Hymenobacter saemangeumensis]